MNYLAEILAFEQWLETHYLPILAQLLWYKLMYFCNRSGWSEWVTVDNLRLMAATQMSREATLIKARDELIKAGLVEYQRGKKGSPNRYHMIPAEERNTFKSEVQSAVKNEVQNAVQQVVKGVAESADIYKQKQNKNKRERAPLSPVQYIEEFLRTYPKQNINRPGTEYAYCRALLEDCRLTEQDLVAAAQNYAEAMGILARKDEFIRNPESFLSQNFFVKYLPGEYVRPKAEKKKAQNSFNQFPQNEYDFRTLENDLLAN